MPLGASSNYVYVNVLVLSSDSPVVYSVSVHFNQGATLLANGNFQTVTTWDQDLTGVNGSRTGARDAIRDSISEYVDIFSNDYLTVNPQP